MEPEEDGHADESEEEADSDDDEDDEDLVGIKMGDALAMMGATSGGPPSAPTGPPPAPSGPPPAGPPSGPPSGPPTTEDSDSEESLDTPDMESSGVMRMFKMMILNRMMLL